MWSQRLWAFIIGTGSLVVGVMRFIPIERLSGWETAEPVHGIFHLAPGAAWMVSVWYQKGRYAEMANKALGIFWLVVGVLGNLGLLDGVEALAFDDNGVHLIIGAVSTGVGWGQPAVARRTNTMRRHTGPRLIWLATLANLIAWVLFPPGDDGRPDYLRQVVAEMTATTAVILFAAALLLSTRALWLESHFGGLDKAYRAHRNAAVAGFLLLVSHVALIPGGSNPPVGCPPD